MRQLMFFITCVFALPPSPHLRVRPVANPSNPQWANSNAVKMMEGAYRYLPADEIGGERRQSIVLTVRPASPRRRGHQATCPTSPNPTPAAILPQLS